MDLRISLVLVLKICLLATTYAEGERNSTAEEQAVQDLLRRLIPQHADHFKITVDFDFDVKDAFQVSSEEGNVRVVGTRGYSAAAGVWFYLKRFCGCQLGWSGAQMQLPTTLPPLTHPVTIRFNDRYRYYQNVCTASYSFVWWEWDRWEREIDWMALNGMNLILAPTAQEYIYHKVFKGLNFTDHDIDVFFTGPAFLAWNRMGNMQAWVGPLTSNWLEHQVRLQHRILDRLRAFGMTTVLPAFSGRVLPAFNREFPDSNTTYLNKTWGNFQPPFGFVKFLEPTDPLFHDIGKKFLENYIEEFGTDHIYTADLFNEMPPPSSDPVYLRSSAKSMYRSLTAVDPQAIWLTQGWMFYSDPDIWKEEQARAFLRAVPQGKMIILDLQSEMYPQYQRLSSYYGQPFIWCMLHNYGGVTGLYGSMESVNEGPFEARNFEGSTMIGTGLTPEGIETNDIVYELMNEMAYRKEPVNLQDWLKDFSRRRYGIISPYLESALIYLQRGVYNATAPYRNHGKYILIRRPSLKLKPYLWYDPRDVFTAWGLFLNASEAAASSKLYRHDLVDLTRQALQLSMDAFYPKLVRAFKKRNVTALSDAAATILQLFDDMDELLASNEHFLLGRWLSAAISLAKTPLEQRQYEYNARNQVTLWGPSGEILDYANKQWNGLISKYYKQRWKLFFQTLEDSLQNRKPFKQSDFNNAVYRQVEYEFNMGQEYHSIKPEGDPILLSRKNFQKYGFIMGHQNL